MEIQPDGYGVYWNDRASISHQELFSHGEEISLSVQAFHNYLLYRTLSTSEACSVLDCSRQNVDDLMRRGKLHSIRTDAKYKLFSKAEVLERKKYQT